MSQLADILNVPHTMWPQVNTVLILVMIGLFIHALIRSTPASIASRLAKAEERIATADRKADLAAKTATTLRRELERSVDGMLLELRHYSGNVETLLGERSNTADIESRMHSIESNHQTLDAAILKVVDELGRLACFGTKPEGVCPVSNGPCPLFSPSPEPKESEGGDR